MKNTFPLFVMIILSMSLQAQDAQMSAMRKNAFKTTFLSFFTGSAKLTYERATVEHQSFELTGGVIGVGGDKFDMNPKGGLFRAAYKFMFSQPENTALDGLYIKPEYAISFFDHDMPDHERLHSSKQTVMSCFGWQWSANMMIFDGFVGAGVGWGNPSEADNPDRLRYHHGFIERFSWLTLTFGLKFGLAF